MSSPITVIPTELILHDLTLRELKVLLALYSFRNKETNLICPKREKIAERSGFSPNRVSEITAGLCEKKFLRKTGTGGRSSPCRYRITLPKLGTVTKSGSKTLPNLGRGKEQISKQINKAIAHFDKFWTVYPRRVSKKRAENIWCRNNCDAVADQIVEDVRRRCMGEWSDPDRKQFIPHPDKYLTDERWTDDDPTAYEQPTKSTKPADNFNEWNRAPW